ncbi:MAG TPA: NAD-dependent epimerase/dehydratase family protein [Baekduia sp.]|uniref:NAD-dependent epimerase/dehydratase family protein n=1 Tax=Baekduia sp. TaxID=2600305 RepID=UPI002D796071|nr:NAD-dependent epimerase/dehydratase family protein [Baekduia sp.]HET6505337.1 NAD-dependent epimerase/dehydratase family protein [Baekduia sp.]
MRSVVLVTGGAGFIGSHVVDRLIAAGHEPRIFDQRPSPWHDPKDVQTIIGDLRRVEDLRRALRGCDAICHLAAAADVGEVHAHPHWATELNGGGTLNVLEAAREAGVQRVVYASTVWVYSDVPAEEVDEATPLLPPAHLYTAGKLAGELYCRSYAELYGLKTTVVRFGIPYGPRARPAAVIPSFVDRALRGEPLTIAGTGEQERSFVYVEDLADGVVRALAPQAVGKTYNLATRETTTIRELAEIVRDTVGAVDIVHTDGRAGDLRGARIDSTRAEDELGWRAHTHLRDGIAAYVAWLREQPGTSVAAPTSAPAEHRRLARVARAGLGNPAGVGIVALIAVASATIAVILGARQDAQAADFTALGSAILVPLWALTVVPWPPEHRRHQVATTTLLAVLGVVLLGLLSSASGGGGVHPMRIALAVALSACLTSAFRILPRRLAALRPNA